MKSDFSFAYPLIWLLVALSAAKVVAAQPVDFSKQIAPVLEKKCLSCHNPNGFTLWMMGAGVKGGVSYGATDQFGRRAEENPTTVWDFYSTVLHLLGLDYEKLSYYHNGIDQRLTDVHGGVVKQVLA
jgi:hypothetical protein